MAVVRKQSTVSTAQSTLFANSATFLATLATFLPTLATFLKKKNPATGFSSAGRIGTRFRRD